QQSVGDIARHLGLSPKTVYTYKRCTMHKLGFTRNTELYHWLINCGLDTERKEIA
ncbi:LuxR C-terminal-related transcriptional regulator, partial [Serratia marcescens]|nr:LuxR C-terminal-related transcriptional regulator [Serratia marcescens]